MDAYVEPVVDRFGFLYYEIRFEVNGKITAGPRYCYRETAIQALQSLAKNLGCTIRT